MRTISWLHFTDFHQGMNAQSHLWPGVRDNLLDDLKRLHERSGPWDLVLFTGDLTQQGLADEFARFDETLASLWDVFDELGSTPVLLPVPGNHDLEWPDRLSPEAFVLKLWDSNPEVQQDLLEADTSRYREFLQDVFANYTHWLNHTEIPKPAVFTHGLLPGDFSATIGKDGFELGVVGLNSAFLQLGRGDYEGKLAVDVRQLHAPCRGDGPAWLRRHDCALLLTHHPPAWLSEAAREHLYAEIHTPGRFAVHLFGHMHAHALNSTAIGAAAARCELQGHSLFGLEHWGDGDKQTRQHGYSAGALTLADDGQASLQIWPRVGKRHAAGHWHLRQDLDAYTLNDNHATNPIPVKTLRAVIRPSRGLEPCVPVDQFVTKIREAVRNENPRLNFVGFPPEIHSRTTVDRADVFVAPILTRLGSDEDVFDDLVTVCRNPTERGGLTNAVILGEPGSGKSTLCRVVARKVARDGLLGPAPLQLCVRELRPEDRGESLLELVARQLRRRNVLEVGEPVLSELCEAGRALLLVDGLDEASTSSWKIEFIDQLHAFAVRYPLVPLVITSRKVDYCEAPLDPQRFTTLHLEPFDDTRLDQFIVRWYAVAIPDEAERAQGLSSLRAALEARPQARELARNPLLATLVVLVHYSEATGELPARRADLFRLCVELLVRDWPEKWNRAFELSGDWQLGQLGVLALWMQEARVADSGILVRSEVLTRKLEELLAGHPDNLVVSKKLGLASRWREWLVDSNLLQIQGRDYGFVHRSLMEFLAACGLHDTLADPEWIADVVVKHRGDSKWHQVILLLLGRHASDGAFCEQILGTLVRNSTHSFHATLLLSALCEDLAITAKLRASLLETVANILGQWHGRPRHSGHANIVGEVIRFSERHGSVVKSWLVEQAGRQTGYPLAGVLLMAPDSVSVEAEILRRALSPEDMMLLLELGRVENWGNWAIQRASKSELLLWSRSTPISLVVSHAVTTMLTSEDVAGSWILGLLNRVAWLASVHETGPRTMAWSLGPARFKASLTPAFSLEDRQSRPESDSSHGRTSADDAVLRFVTGHFCSKRLLQNRVVSQASLIRYHSDLRAVPLNGHLRNWAMSEGGDPLGVENHLTKLARARGAIGPDECLPKLTWNEATKPFAPSRPDAAPSEVPWVCESEGELRAMTLAFFANVHASMIATKEHSTGVLLGQMRAQNLWLNLYFDALVDLVACETGTSPNTLTPSRHAMLLALGLAQYQTTWRWPLGERWHDWFSGSPPEHWLPSYIWHLCWAVGEPDKKLTHVGMAEACLERNDWPELAASLREESLVCTVSSQGPNSEPT